MTEKQRILRKNLLARIHTNSRYKELLKVDAWESWLDVRFGVSSSALLSIDELNKALDMLINDEFMECEPDILGRNLVKNSKIINNLTKNKTKKITQKQYTYIKHLANRLNFSDEKLMVFVAKQIKVLIRLDSQLKRISLNDARRIITGLEKMCKFYKK
ncbi:DUF1018 domain-containing protein [Campylobacter ureolyticus]|uniref:DUF1018 domain-containing protein n=1 Tax=Campylobacter ureolyticus TaxID=827 RepID=UPI0022B56477|nr:DUF1018 domain-containing protein [Campylobacter ureolyticus]MCZ6103989.1 DUF1018 domain-containing protein [Campylobacter ureolyticus]